MPELDDDTPLGQVLAWCVATLGPVNVLADHSRHHPESERSTVRIETAQGPCFIKMHADEEHWAQEVHGYEHWATAFADFAPELLAARDELPYAVVVSERSGKVLEEVELAPEQERAAWHAAGKALVALHELAVGEYFGPCRRDGACAGQPTHDAVAYITTLIDDALEKGRQTNCLSDSEQAVGQAALALIPAFAGQSPVPCHYDYCPANWLVDEEGAWNGVIDFERSHWDVAEADYTRDPDWSWLERPDLLEAFFAGYGYVATAKAEQRRLVADTLYALSTVVWASRVGYHGSLREARKALVHIEQRLGL